MDGIKRNGVGFHIGKLPGRKQECFYFTEGTRLLPAGYISKDNLPEAKRLWGRLFSLEVDSLNAK